MALHRTFGAIVIFLYFKCVLTANICHVDEIWKQGHRPEPTCNNLFPEINIFDYGCFCNANHVRNDQGKCVHINDCPKFEIPFLREHLTHHHHTCGEGEIWRNEFYPEPTCDDLFPELDIYHTREGCFCKDDLVRNRDGKCINLRDCPQYIWPSDMLYDESYDYSPISDSFLEPFIENNGMFIDIADTDAYNSYLQPSYAAQSLENWIQEQIPASDGIYNRNFLLDYDLYQKRADPDPVSGNESKCIPGEIWGFGGIPERSCAERSPKQVSPKIGCFCINDYLRNAEGKCIPEAECTQKRADDICTTGETFQAGYLPEPQCNNRSPERAEFAQKCFCNDGMFRNKENKCVTAIECDAEKRAEANSVCPEGEVDSFGGSPQPTCDQRSPVQTSGGKGCFCPDKMYRNKEGRCVTETECDAEKRAETGPRCPPNEIFKVGFLPEPECDNPSPVKRNSVKMCFCRNNMYRNYEGRCVTKAECHTIKRAETDSTCPTNETFEAGYLPEPQCNNRSPERTEFAQKCFCNDGMFRNKENKCVTAVECDAEKRAEANSVCPEGEVDSFGGSPQPTCDQRSPVQTSGGKGCFCPDKMYRNKEGRCVTETECDAEKRAETDSTCPTNETFEAGYLPEPQCNNRSPERTEFAQKCFCNDGMFRNKENKCVTAIECNAEKRAEANSVCPEGEVDSFGGSPQPTCDQRSPVQTSGGKGCFCPDKMYRNKEGRCVTETECDAEKRAGPTICPTYEVYRVGTIPQRTCDVPNPIITNTITGCFCNENLIRNKIGQCVPIQHCMLTTNSASRHSYAPYG